jgi:GTP pyrophosphokinase
MACRGHRQRPRPDEALAFVEPRPSSRPPARRRLLRQRRPLRREAHSRQQRQNGEPYIIHPIAVAEILAELPAGQRHAGHRAAARRGGGHRSRPARDRAPLRPEVARLVDGVTKLSRIEVQSERTKQAENLRKLSWRCPRTCASSS